MRPRSALAHLRTHASARSRSKLFAASPVQAWMRHAPLALWLCAVLSLSCGRAHEASAPPPGEALQLPPRKYADVRVEGVPHVRQKPDFCGEACVEMALAKIGRRLSQDQVFDLSGVDPSLGRGVVTTELKTALERVGFDPGDVWYEVAPARAGAELSEQFDAVHEDLKKGMPSIVCMHYADRKQTTEHFRIVTGYDAALDEVIYNEPAEDDGAARRMPRALFLKLWPLKYNARHWTVVRFRLRPTAKVPLVTPKPGFTSAAFAQHVLALKERIGKNFTVVVEPPFVVIGDESEATVRHRAASTVRWATTKLKAAYFTRDPKRILDIYLFKDDRSYRANARALFDDTPDTPYGYYSSRHKALIMNISTGGGTLVHEIVHPFIEANFPACPPWFNEGLGSLYEQSGEEDGQIIGDTNWRLAGLQASIRKREVPAFAKLMAMSEREFYDEDQGTNYAQARYLLYYLQMRGLLTRYYKEFHKNQKHDPTGLATLKSVLGEADMDAFKDRWEAFVMKLRFP
jgi:hypothetical protein